MPQPQITNPLGAYTGGAQWGLAYGTVDQMVTDVKNDPSGATRTAGDVVIAALDASNNPIIQSTTTANNKSVLGVVGPAGQNNWQTDGSTYAVGTNVPVVVRGFARINIAANTVAAGDLLTTSTGAGAAATNAGAPAANTVTGSIIAVALEASTAKDTNNTIRAYIAKF